MFRKFGSVGRTDAPIALPLGVSHVFCSSVGGVVRARARHFWALRKQLERNQRKSLNSIWNFQESENSDVFTAEVLKKLEFAFPPSMGSNIFFDSHVAWERKFQLFQHLCSENASLKNPLLFFVGAIRLILGTPAAEVLKKVFCMILL